MKSSTANDPILNDNYFMQQAIGEAHQALEEDEVPIGCVIVHNGRIIARAHNLTERFQDITAHAEVQAITSAANVIGAKYLKDCTLYVTVEPCPMCAGAIAWAQISRVVFGASDNKRGYTQFQPCLLHPKTTTTQGVLSEECAAIIRTFFKKIRS